MKSYSRNEVFKKSLEYFKGDSLAADVWINKYSLKDSDGNIYELTPNDMHDRLASELSRIENKYPNPLSKEKIFDLIKDFKYIVPQGGPMAGIGNNLQTISLSNCFVIGNDADSYGGIMMTDQEQAQLMKRRGGVGHDLSHIRPKGSPVKNSALTSTGVVPFMERFSNSTREVAQDGRRGALMLTISVKHPDAEDFIDAKMTQGKVTGANVSVKLTDEFMECVRDKKPFVQQYPIDSDNPLYTKEIDANKLWNKIVHNAWQSAEPGLMFWDTISREAIPDCYSEHGFKTISTNPCLVGDTLVSVADGRNFISIKQLAEEGKDIPVYCLDNDGKLVIRTMRNPRITGYNKEIYKVTLEGGHTIRVTGNHKFRLKNGDYIETKDLKFGDSLHILTKYQSPIVKDNNLSKKDYFWLNNGEFKSNKIEHRFIYEQLNNMKIEPNNILHHIDYDTLNNNLNNLKMMSKKDHDEFHSIDMLGDKNPYHKMTDDWRFNFASHKGESNHRFSGISNEEIKNHMISLTKKLNRRISKKDWIEYAKENNLPQSFSEWRGYNSTVALSKLVASELNIEFIHTDPRLVKSYENALSNGYNTKIVDNEVLVEKTCEYCGGLFWINYQRREISFCSHTCALNHINNNVNIKNKRTDSLNTTYSNKGQDNKYNQLKIFKGLEFELNRTPLLKEWEQNCKENNIPYRLKTKYGFESFSELKEEAGYFNHKVISVELDGFEDVYNGTVDEFHNFFSGGFQEFTKSGKPKYLSINQLNCGEIPLNQYDSCRLLAINLYAYVENPFTENAKFNWELFEEHSIYAQRFMDDIVDLEVEKVDAILEKIKNDPEPEYIKIVEIKLWEKIREKAIQGRRTGLGITSEGDMLAALGITYGSEESIEFSTKVHKILAISAYKSSIIMAKERGSFEVFDFNKEKENPFVKRILNELSDEYVEMWKNTGRRNIALLTIAPTGSVSIMTQTSSGIEPVFLPVYTRRRKINPNDKNAKISFVDEVGDFWEEYNVFHPKFKTWSEVNGYNVEELEKSKPSEIEKIVKLSPYHKATSNDVDWVSKVKLQGSVQKWIDHSISVTVNLPNYATEEIVGKVYQTGWESGCKGITVYRDGSRSGVLISNKEANKKTNVFTENNAPKRPELLPCDVYRFQNKGEKWIGFMGLLDNRPYEIFTGLQESVNIPNYVSNGHIFKIKNAETDGKSRYDFIYIDKDGYKQEFRGLSRAFNREYWNTGRLISGILRHGMPIPNVLQLIDKLHFDNEDSISSWKSGIKRTLKKYIKEGTLVKGETCDNCGSSNIIYKEGCMTCMDCQTSKCE